MKRFIVLISVWVLFCSTIYAQSDENSTERDKKKEREAVRAEQQLREFESQRERAEAMKAELEAQAQYEEALRMREMEEHLKTQHKELQKVLTDLQSKEKSTYNKVLHDLYNQWDNLKALEEDNKELADLETKVRASEIKLGMQEKEYQKLRSVEKKEKAKVELKNQLRELFELKVKKRKMEIESLKNELEKLEDELKNIRKNKEQSINMKLQQMTEGDIFTW